MSIYSPSNQSINQSIVFPLCLIQADVLLLDDVLAAVDAHVGKRLFEKCISGYLQGEQGKTVVLVTNQLSLLPAADSVVVMRDGRMVEHGPCEELRQKGKGNAFVDLMNEFVPEEEEEGKKEEGGNGSLAKSPSALRLERAESLGSSVPDELRRSAAADAAFLSPVRAEAGPGRRISIDGLLPLS